MNYRDLRHRIASQHDRYVHHFSADDGAARTSFADVAARVGALSQRLMSHGVVAGWRVGIVGPNDIDWLVWDLALIELGCTVVALPDELLAAHGDQLFETYDLSFIVKARGAPGAGFVAGHPNTVWMNDVDCPSLSSRPATGNTPFGIDGVCALAFSSGVSGVPKCLMINSRGIEWDVAHYIPAYRPRADDRLLVFLPLTHQQQRLLVYAAYWHGTSFVLVRAEHLFPALALFKPTLCLAPPLLYEGMHDRYLTALEAMSPRRRALWSRLLRGLSLLPPALARPVRRRLFKKVHDALGGHMRLMITGMAPIKRASLDFFEAAGIPLFEAYGLTETGVIAANTPGQQRVGSVGKPVAGCRITLGLDGEVMVRREQFASFGYLDDRGTSQPFALGQPVATGDIGRFDEDGYLYLLGRKKEIIITSQGLKLHPERFEALLHAHPAIARAVVFSDDRQRLAVLLSVRPAPTPALQTELEALVAQVTAQVAGAARIGTTLLTQELFTLANGLLTRSLKLDRRAIESRFAVELLGRQAPQPVALTAAQLAQVDHEILGWVREAWQEVLERSEVPLTANFFELGGDSLCAMRVVTRLQEKLDSQLGVGELLMEPTLYGVARRLTLERNSKRDQSVARTDLEEGVI